jgi:uncharacterized protein (DUF1501 family)
MALTRRAFVCRSFASFGAAVLALERFALLPVLALAGDYKALVCIFLFGGNDSGNMLIPYDDYATYAAVRQNAGLALPQSSLLPINVPSLGSQLAFHPSCTGLHALWGQGKVAVVCNVGPLVEPTTSTAYRNGAARLPLNLFSHADQQNQWQTSVANGSSAAGWGGHTADKTAQLNASTLPVVLSVAGTPVFVTGNTEQALALAAAPTRLDVALPLDGFLTPPEADAHYRAMRDLLQVDQHLRLAHGAGQVTRKALEAQGTLRLMGDPSVPPFPLNPRTSLGNQLEQIAKLISVREALGMRRQIFFCALGGFDTHSGQVATGNPTAGTQADLLAQVGNAMQAFYEATVALGVASQVVTFTLSDFARTFVPNGNLGTDHAWGAHHVVIGGAVRGGDCYGVPGSNGTVFPTLAPAGPDDTDEGSGARGRWIPTVAVDQYSATLVSWFGVGNADLTAVFPNLGRFSSPSLGFLG